MCIIKKLMCKTLLLMLMIIISPLIMGEQACAGSVNVVQGKTAICKYFGYAGGNGKNVDISYMVPYGPSRAVDGKTDALSRWQTRKGVEGSYLQVNLGGMYSIDRWIVYNQSYAWNNDATYAMKGYKLQKSNDGVNFTDVDVVAGNNSSKTDRTVTRFTASYLRVQVTAGCLDANNNSWDSIVEFQAFGDPVALPSVSTTSVSGISGNSAEINGTVISDGGADIMERGFVYSLNDNPTLNGSGVYSSIVNGATGDFSQTITTGIVKNTKYYYRAYAKNIKGITYGDVGNFITLDWRADISVSNPLSEESLNSKEILVNLTGDTFKDVVLDAANFTLVNPPAGLTVGGVSYGNSAQCTVSLSFDGTDFDLDVSNLSLAINGAELSGGINLNAANNLSITARKEPTDINLSALVIGENNLAGAIVGIFSTVDQDQGDLFTYSLAVGQGDEDNGDFAIQGDNLLAGCEFDYETKNSYSIRVKTTDYLGSIYEKNFIIGITDANDKVNITGISIKTQPAMDYNNGDNLSLANLEVTLHKNNGTTEDVAFADFTAKGLTVSKADGSILALSDDGTSIMITHAGSGQTAQTGTFTVKALPVKTFTVAFKDWDGSTIDTQIVNEGNGATAPPDPTRPGYIFTGWDKTFSKITSDLMVTAQYIEDIPAVTDADKIAQDKAVLNIGFSPGDNENSVTKDITLQAAGTTNGSTITWNSAKPSVISTAGAVARPQFLAGDAQILITATISYNGASDTKEFMLTVLKLEPITYTVTFKDWDGSTLKIQAVNEARGATAPGNPARSGYTFIGWDAAFDNVCSNLTIKAKYNQNDFAVAGGGGGGSGSGGSAPSQPPKIETKAAQNRVTATTITIATPDSSGKATSQVTKAQVTEAINKAVEAVKQGRGIKAVVEIKVKVAVDVKTVETIIPVAAINAVADNGISGLTVSTPIASLAFDKKALNTISQAASGDVKVSVSVVSTAALNREAQQIVGDRPVYKFSVTSGNNTIAQFGGNVDVTVPYTPKAGENTNSIIIYYINSQGKLETVGKCAYDAATGTIKFSTNHFSQYAVGYNEISFKDVSSDAWYGNAVSFVAARGVATGLGEGNYNPNGNVTRGQFIVMVLRAYGISADENPKDNFTDGGNKYYTGYLAEAKRLGIAAGIGNNKFAPEKEITRQEMLALLHNTLKEIDQLPTAATDGKFLAYSDAREIAPWAKNAVRLFVDAGTINGDNGRLNPKSAVNRAEMAQVFYNLLSK